MVLGNSADQYIWHVFQYDHFVPKSSKHYVAFFRLIVIILPCIFSFHTSLLLRYQYNIKIIFISGIHILMRCALDL